MAGPDDATPTRSDFIREIIADDLRAARHGGRVVTRFPPEPNGYLHIGHAKSICLNFGIAAEHRAPCYLRFDDTNPLTESVEFVRSIEEDVHWLGFEYGDAPAHAPTYASDYFPQMYQLAEDLVRAGLAYVDDQSEDEIREHRGALGEPGRASPGRQRPAEENLALLRQMRAGDLPDGACVLRARIDLAASNMKMRDPLLYRIRHATHHRTGDEWPIYPMYDFAHPISDALEGITHSICTLEFENNRELYDWVLEHTRAAERHGFTRPHQYEFARLNLDYTVLSKRRLLRLVEDGHVAGWDDPRMPTIAGMRRRGYRPEAIRAFTDMIGVAKVNSVVDVGKLEHCVRDDLNHTAPRVLGVLRPLEVTITTWPEGDPEQLVAPYFPPDVGLPGERKMPFGRRILIERDDFSLDPPPGYQRLAPGRTVRLRHGYCITFEGVEEVGGEVVGLRCRHVPGSVGINPEGLKLSGVIHWVSADDAVEADVRLYDRLFSVASPDGSDADLAANLNPASLEVVSGARMEPSLAAAEVGSRWQLERLGYFVVDDAASPEGRLTLNRIVTLKDTWKAATAATAGTAATAPETGPSGAATPSAKASTRPPRRSRVEYRAEARARDPLLAGRFAAWPSSLGIAEADADLLTADRAVGDLFEAALAAGGPPAALARFLVNELPPVLGDRALGDTPLSGAAVGALVGALEAGDLSAGAAREVFAELAERGGDPAEIVARRGLAQVSDEAALTAAVDGVVAAHPDKAADYRAGKTALVGFFVGQAMRATGGSANPQVLRRLIEARLS